MKILIRRTALFTLTIILSFLFTSCPLPITEKLVAAIEDEFAPIITITDPLYGDTYYSEVRITGVLTDHAISNGDGKGSISTFSFSASSNNAYRGGIRINSLGVVTKDPSLGDVDILYSPTTGDFSFLMNTASYYGSMQIDFLAVDLNGNSTTTSFQLRESNGPLVTLTHPDTPQYTQGQTIHIEGTVQDSLSEPDSIDEIQTLTCTMQELGVFGSDSVVLNVAAELPNPAPDIIFHSNKSQGFDFTLVKATRIFSADVTLPGSFTNSVTIIVTATDKNGKTSSPRTIQLTRNTGESYLSFNQPGSQKTYYSPTQSTAMPIEVWVDPGAYPLTGLSLRVQSSSRTENFDFLPFYNPVTLLSARTIDLTGGHTGNATLTMTSTTTDSTPTDYQTSLNTTLYEDSVAPDITGISFVVGDGDSWARTGDSAELEFTVADSGSGFSDSEDDLIVTIAGVTVVPVLGGDGIWRASQALPGNLGVNHDDAIPFTIRPFDRLGNNITVDETSVATVEYYHDVPSSMPPVTITKTTAATATNWLSADAINEVLTIDLPDNRTLNIDADDFQLVFNDSLTRNVDCSGAGYTGTYTMVGDEPNGEVTFNWHYLDMAGNETTYTDKPTVFEVDNDKPQLTDDRIISSYSTDTSIVPDGEEARVRFKQSDSGGSGLSSANPTVDFYINGTLVSADVEAAYSSGYWRVDYPVTGATLQGEITAIAHTADNAGNAATLTIDDNIYIDSKAPNLDGTETIVSNAFVSGDTGLAAIGDTIKLSFTLDEGVKSDTDPIVTFTIGGETVQTSETVLDGVIRKMWIAEYTVLAPNPVLSGTVTASIGNIMDQYGNEPSTPFTVDPLPANDVSVDNVVPSAPILSVSSPAVGPNYANGESVTVTVMVDAADTDAAGVTVTCNGTDHSDDTLVAGVGEVTFLLPSPATQQTYSITAVVIDAHGNEGSSASETVTVDAP